jgi:acyl-CoA hydrolase
VRTGELVEAYARVCLIRGRALMVEVDVIAEDLITGERRKVLCGTFRMVAVRSREPVATRDSADAQELSG